MERKVINLTSPYDSTQYGFPHAIKANGTTTIHCAEFNLARLYDRN